MMSAVCVKSTFGLLCLHTYRPGQRSVLRLQSIIRSIKTDGPILQKVRMTKMLEKMLKKGGKKKWSGAHTSVFANSDGNERHHTYKVTEGNRRRAEQVGKVLYDYIISLVNSGELHPELVENSVEIATVKMAVDFSGINVYWYASGQDSDSDTQSLLNNNAGKLREMLISLRIIGSVPKINFVQDLSQAKVAELDRLLKMADRGPSDEEMTNTEGTDGDMVVSHGQLILNKGYNYSPDQLNRDFQKKPGTFDTFSPNYTVLHTSVISERLNAEQMQSAVANESCNNNNNNYIREDNSGISSLKGQGSTEVGAALPGSIPFRHDVYSVKRDELVNKVMAMKHKAKYRTIDPDFQSNDVSGVSFPQFSTLKSFGNTKKSTPPKLPKLKKYSMADYLLENQERFTGKLSSSELEGYESLFEDEPDIGPDYDEKK